MQTRLRYPWYIPVIFLLLEKAWNRYIPGIYLGYENGCHMTGIPGISQGYDIHGHNPGIYQVYTTKFPSMGIPDAAAPPEKPALPTPPPIRAGEVTKLEAGPAVVD